MAANATVKAIQPENREPRWPAILALLGVGGLHYALPASLSMGPGWLLMAFVAVLLIPTVLTHRLGHVQMNQILGYILLAVVTLSMVWSLSLLVLAIPAHKQAPSDLLRSGAILWITNILVFASWYWRLDAGGPHARDLRDAHTEGAFLFPQMILQPNSKKTVGQRGWHPGFIDYLFLAFNTSTAFSPTDSPVLSRWAKVLMMIQALISFTTVAILVARAVNIL